MNRKRNNTVLVLSIVVVLILLAIVSRIFFTHNRIEKNHKDIEEFVKNEMTYEPAKMDKDLETINQWLDSDYVSDDDKGLLYERAALIYNGKGEMLNYYENLGRALYYLEKADDRKISLNIYADLATYYITNCSYDNAQTMIDRIVERQSFNGIEDIQIKSYVYRIQGIIYTKTGNYSQAKYYLDIAESITLEAKDELWAPAYIAMNDVARADLFFHMGNVEYTKVILDRYEGSTFFTDDIYRQVLARDFIIPYYEVYVKYAASQWDFADAQPIIETYIAYCDEFGYYRMELDTLLTIMEEYPPINVESTEAMYDRVNEVYANLSKKHIDDYILLLDNQLLESKQNMEAVETKKQENERGRNAIIIFFLVIFGFIAICTIAIRIAITDGLTKIGNRRAFNFAYKNALKNGKNFAVAIIDIDNFKSVNDTYGHSVGDEVLAEIGSILKGIERYKVNAYRYGGEEFAIIVRDGDDKAAILLAEHVRRDVEAVVWNNMDRQITVSIGVADHKVGVDPISKADENLYYVKEHGKNAIGFLDKDEILLYKK